MVASDDAFFGLPEVDRGALGAATHLARLVPQHKMRAMVYTGATATAAELHAFGSVLQVVPRDELRDAAFELAADIAAKSPTVMRAAKESLNGIDLWDVKRSYRFEQGFTFELNLAGVSDELRDAFVEKRDADTSKIVASQRGKGSNVIDKRMTEEDVVAELRDGMTIGIGGWGSRRKPMSIVRAIANSDVKDLTVASYAGPDLGLLCATGKVKKAIYPFCSLDSIALEPHFRNARQSGSVQTLELDEGMFLLGLQAAAWRVPFIPTRVGLGTFVVDRQPEIKTVVSPYDDGEELVAAPALNLDVAIIHMHRGDARGNGQYLNVDPYMDNLVALAAPTCFMSVEQLVPTEDLAIERPGADAADQPAHDARCGRGAEGRALHRVRARLRPRRGVPEGVRRERQGPGRMGGVEDQVPRLRRSRRVPEGGRTVSDVTRADYCTIGVAECFRGDGEIMANPIGTIPAIGGRLARDVFEPDLVMTDGEALLVSNGIPVGVDAPDKTIEAWNPYRTMFDVVWSGRRHVMMGASQLDAVRQPELRVHRRSRAAEGAAARHARRARQHGAERHQLLDPRALAARVRREASTSCRASATTAPPSWATG